MKTSRMDGKLVLETRRPYLVAVNGAEQERHKIVCLDVTPRAEMAAFDLEQYVTSAMFDIAERQAKNNRQIEGDQDGGAFFDEDMPSDEDINQQMTLIEMTLKSNRSVKISMVFEAFHGILDAGLITSDTGDKILPGGIWEKIHRTDKLRIMCGYISFFANPLESLQGLQLEDSSEGTSDTDKGS